MTVKRSDKILIGVGLAAVIGSVAAFGPAAYRAGRSISNSADRVKFSTVPFPPAVEDPVPATTGKWLPPTAQPRGPEWIFDLFTPPEIFYSERSRQFTVLPPQAMLEDESAGAFGIELVSVRAEPFRLQLIGFVGQEGDWRGTFENVSSGEVFLATAGCRFPELALTIRSLDVGRRENSPVGEPLARGLVAVAVVHDESLGCDVALRQDERQHTGNGSALVALAGESAEREVRPGDTLEVGKTRYHIDAIHMSPAAVEITRESPGLAEPERRKLTPRDEAGGGRQVLSVKS